MKRLPLPKATGPGSVAETLDMAVSEKRVLLLEKMSRYVLSGVWDATGLFSRNVGGAWPWYPDIEIEHVEGGRSNKILNANRSKKSRLLTGNIEPDSEGPSAFVSSARKAFFRERYKGKGNYNPWRPHVFSYFDDYELLGIGATFHSLTENRDTGKKAVDVKHVPLQHVLYSRFVSNPIDSPWVVVRHVLSLNEAKHRYPNAWSGAVEDFENVGFAQHQKCVVMIEYFDIGLDGNDPAHFVWLKDWRRDPVVKERNPWGRFLPVSFMVNNVLPGAKYPVGSVFTMMRTQAVINEIERGLVRRARQGPLRVWNESKLNQQDLAQFLQGVNNGNLRLETGEEPETLDQIVFQLPGMALSNADVEGLAHFERQIGEDSALSQIDQNSVLQSQRTLGEIEQMQAAGASNRAFDDQNTKEGLVMFAEKVFYTAKMGDDDPVEITVVLPDQRKRKMTVNLDEASSSAMLFEEPAEITLDVSALTAQDATVNMNNRLRNLERIAAFIAQNSQAAMKYGDKLAQEAIAAIGEDPDDWASAPQGLQAMAAGQMLPPGAVPAVPGLPA